MLLDDGEGKEWLGSIAPYINFCCPALVCKGLLCRTDGCGFRLVMRWDCFPGGNQLHRVDTRTRFTYRRPVPPNAVSWPSRFLALLCCHSQRSGRGRCFALPQPDPGKGRGAARVLAVFGVPLFLVWRQHDQIRQSARDMLAEELPQQIIPRGTTFVLVPPRIGLNHRSKPIDIRRFQTRRKLGLIGQRGQI